MELFRTKARGSFYRIVLDGLLGDERRKTGWMRAEAAGDPGRQQGILGRGRWDVDPDCATSCVAMYDRTSWGWRCSFGDR
jgi:hypothetical protein